MLPPTPRKGTRRTIGRASSVWAMMVVMMGDDGADDDGADGGGDDDG